MVTKSMGDEWLGAPALAGMLGITLRTVYVLIDSGALRAYRFTRVIRVRRADVDVFLQSARVKPGELRHLYPPGDSGDGLKQR